MEQSSDDEPSSNTGGNTSMMEEGLTSSKLLDEKYERSYILWVYSSICSSIQVVLLVIFAVLSIMVVVNLFLYTNTTTVVEPPENPSDNSILSKVYDLSDRIAMMLGIKYSDPVELPSLIVQITVDQLRSDLMLKYRKRFIENGGFDFLMKNGVIYRNARYRQARTVTPVGHSTLFTGGVPYSHGIVGHYFLDPILNKIVYSIDDKSYTEVEGKEELGGSAPTYLESTTTGDELRIFSNNSKVFSVSVKDKPSILCAGRLGKSFWLSDKTGNVISSTFFYDQYPQYVTEWNSKKVPFSYLDKFWELSYPQNIYHFQDRSYVKPVNGKEFPKPFFHDNTQDFLWGLIYSPYSDRVMWDFTKTLIVEEELGKRTQRGSSIIDLLSISISSLDKVGHNCGHNSIEGEDTVYKIDELLTEMFQFFDEYIGLENCLIVLSADHGGDLDWQQILDIGFDHNEIYSEESAPILEQFLNQTVFGGELREPVLLGWSKVNIYFHHDVIVEHGKTVNEVEDAASEWVMETFKEVLFAFTKHDLMNGFVPRTRLGESVLLNFHPERSGDVVLVMKELTRMEDDESPVTVLRHGTNWVYDQRVPIAFFGRGIPSGIVVDRLVSPEDVASTISSYYGFNPPSGNLGDSLREVLVDHDVSYFFN